MKLIHLTANRAVALLVPMLAFGCGDDSVVDNHQASLGLPGSQFEIDDDANLIDDAADPAPDDWATIDPSLVTIVPETASGQDDNSYKGGAKEDQNCPATGTGSIPNNKSDLKTFGVYQEPGDPGFLHLFWTRVQDPSGTTLMDFEFNKNADDCGNGVNPTRVAGDLLLEYRLEQGGATASIKARRWTGSEWGAEEDLTAINAATGTINDSPIADGDSAGLGAMDPRTFGEATIDLGYIFEEGKCDSFGSAFVKSRSSDAFNSALKDYISPTPVNITNCGKVVIRKKTEPAGWGGPYGFTHTLALEGVSGGTFDLNDGGSETFNEVLFGDGYTVTEDALGNDMELTDIDCSASSGVTVDIDLVAGEITFDIDDDSDVVDCTFTNSAKANLYIEKVTTDGVGTFPFDSVALGGFNITTTGTGEPGMGTKSFTNIDPGTYDVSENVPAGWNLLSGVCDNGDDPSSVTVDYGDTVTCRFTNERKRGAIKIVKTRSHAAFGAGPHPHPGVTFLVTGGELGAGVPVVTDANGVACVDGLLLSDFAGNYTVTEELPSGYVPAGDLSKAVSVTTVAQCPNGDQVNFHNTPLTNITVTVDSQVPGGTLSTITCDTTPPANAATDATGDGSLLLQDLVPGTYTCQVVVNP